MRLVHTADSHIGSSRNRIDPESHLNSRLVDFARCARFCVEDGIARRAQLVLHGGDLFNTCRPTPTERRLALDGLGPALDAGIPVVLLLGNHDAPRAPAEKHALDLVRDIPGLTIVDQPALLNVWEGPDSVLVEPPETATPDGRDLALQLACMPWPNKQLLLADQEYRKLDPGQLNELVRQKVMHCLHGLVAQLIPGIPSVLLAHLSVDVAQAGSMNRLMALGGEWTVNVHDLAGLGFDAVCAGHIHKAQVLCEQPWIGYSGSPEAVSFSEEGEPKGYCLLDIRDNGRVEVEQVATPHRRFLTFDLGDGNVLPTADELMGAIVRVRIPADNGVDVSQLRHDLEAAGVHEYQMETQRAEAVRRRAVDVSSEMALEEAIKAYLEQHPDLADMAEALLAEARTIEQAVATGGEA